MDSFKNLFNLNAIHQGSESQTGSFAGNNDIEILETPDGLIES